MCWWSGTLSQFMYGGTTREFTLVNLHISQYPHPTPPSTVFSPEHLLGCACVFSWCPVKWTLSVCCRLFPCVFCSACDDCRGRMKGLYRSLKMSIFKLIAWRNTNHFSKGYSVGIMRFKNTFLRFRCNFCETIIIQQLVGRAVKSYIKITFQPSTISISDI